MKRNSIFLLVVMASVFFWQLAEGSVLVKDGKTASYIVLPEEPGPTVRHASEELAKYLKKVTGADVEIGTVPSKNLCNIYLGTTEDRSIPRTATIDKAIAQLKEDGFILAADKDGLRVIGRQPVGVLYGVYEILKKYADIRWFAPGSDFEYCPKKSTIIVPDQVTISNPAFQVRRLGFVCANVNSKTVDTWDWLVRNGMTLTYGKHLYNTFRELDTEIDKRGGKFFDGGHCFAYLLSDKLFDEHPEYFGLFGGKRMKQDDGDGRGARRQPCTSNPDVVKIMADGVKRYFETEPKGGTYLIGNNDANAWCECENCTRLDPPEEKKKGYVSTRYWTLINQIASNVYKSHPDAEIWAWGYQNFQYPPTGIVPDPRVSVELCVHGRCYRHSLADTSCQVNERYRDMLNQWRKMGNKLSVLEYIDSGCLPPYTPAEKTMAEDIKYYRKIGVSGATLFVVPPDGTLGKEWNTPRYRDDMLSKWQLYYIVAQLLWNPDADYESIYEDMGSKYYGSAWPAMRKYRALLTRAFMETSGHIYYGSPDIALGKCLEKPGVEAELLALLNEAEKAAGQDQTAIARVQLDRRFFQTYWQQLHQKYVSSQPKEFHASKRAGRIVIDGKLEETDWKNADFTDNFITMDGKTPAEPQTFVRILYDKDNIYFGVEAMENEPEKMRVEINKQDGPIWKDNSLEFFIASPETQGEYIHIIINPKGVLYDSLAVSGSSARVDFNTHAEAKTSVLKDRWVAEIRVPTASIGRQIQDGERWKINIARTRLLVDGRSQLSSWSNGIFHGQEGFRPVVFGEMALLKNGDFEDVEKFTEMPAYRKKSFDETKWKFISDCFPAGWSAHQYAGEIEVREDQAASGRKYLRIKSSIGDGGRPALAVIVQQRLPIKQAGVYTLRAKLRGKGEFTPYAWYYDLNTGRPMANFSAKIGETLKVDSKEWVNFEGSVTFDGKSYFSLALYFMSLEGIDIDDVTITRQQAEEKQ